MARPLLGNFGRCRYQRWLSLALAFGLSLLLGLFPLISSSQAVPISSVPNPRLNNTWISDTADLLSPDTENQLNQMFSALEAKNGDEIVVVTVLDTQTFLQPKDFASKLSLTWKLGKTDLHNGVVILISKNENTSSIDLGWGPGIWELFPRHQYDELIASLDKPLEQENFETNLVTVAQAIINKLENSTTEKRLENLTTDPPNALEPATTTEIEQQEHIGLILILVVIVIGIMATMIGTVGPLLGFAFILVCSQAYLRIKKYVIKKKS